MSLQDLRAQAQMIARASDVLAAMVGRARDEGMSWASIGEALGVTKQAAQQRYGS